MKKEKKIIISIAMAIIVLVGIILVCKFVSTGKIVGNELSSTGKTGRNEPVTVVLFSQEERQKIVQTILSTEFIKDIPENNPVALTFFSFENNQRIWRETFLIGNNQLLTKGEPAIRLTLHSKYIAEFNGNNLCEIIQKANRNGDLGFKSEYSEARLFMKYAGMLKHRECFGF
jgi:hypothetical protein